MENNRLISHNDFHGFTHSAKSFFKARLTIPFKRGSSKFGLFILGLLFLSGCEKSEPVVEPKPALARHIFFYHDDKRGVSCWVYDWAEAGGLSCLPDKDFK